MLCSRLSVENLILQVMKQRARTDKTVRDTIQKVGPWLKSRMVFIFSCSKDDLEQYGFADLTDVRNTAILMSMICFYSIFIPCQLPV